MAKLIIKRSSEWNNKLRNIGIYLDKQKIGSIGNGEIKEFEIESGLHTLKTKIDWCGSQTLSLNMSENENKCFELSSSKYGLWLIITPILLLQLCLSLGSMGQMKVFSLQLLLIILISAYVLWYTTKGRNKHLTLKEIEVNEQVTL